MKKEIETVALFLMECVDTDIDDFGYLLLTNDEMLNHEAICNIKIKFETFCLINNEAD